MTRSHTITLLTCTALVFLVLIPRVLDLDQFRTADEKLWQARVFNFTMALAHGEWDNLYQHYQPAITTQWLGAPTVFYDSWVARKLPLVLAQSLFILIVGYILGRLWGPASGVLTVLLLTFNPLLAAHTRIYGMDALLALFLLLWLTSVLLWQQKRETRYLVFSAGAAALAVLSKLPGIIAALFTLLVFGYEIVAHKDTTKRVVQNGALWLLVFGITLLIVLPSLVTNSVPVLRDMLGLFTSSEYTSDHAQGTRYYLFTLLFFSTPLHIVALILMVAAIVHPNVKALLLPTTQRRREVVALALCGLLFLIMMSIGTKKGDRYLLPVFLIFDVLAVAAIAPFIAQVRFRKIRLIGLLLSILLVWQALVTTSLHPYALAYVNPLTKPWFGERRSGWGEGLDAAATYLNKKPVAEKLKVATIYPAEFAPYFVGEVVSANQHDAPSVDYVLLYRTMLQRGPDSWETDIFQQYQQRTPEKVIYLGGIPYVWIYHVDNSD